MANHKEMDGLLMREAPPTHFLLRIDSLSLLSSSSLERFESCEFEACGHKWKLALYPKGHEGRDGKGKGHISLFLVLMNSRSLGLNKDIVVNFSLLLLNQKHDKYCGEQGVCRFDCFKPMFGFSNFLPLSVFFDPSNGYLVDDTCVFGAEIFLVEPTMKGQVVRDVEGPVPFKYTWKLEKFSELKDECHDSDVFTVNDYDFKVSVYPKGDRFGKGKYLSVYIELAESEKLSPGEGVILNYRFCVMNEVKCKSMMSKTCSVCLSALDDNEGIYNLMRLTDLSSSSGYLVNDTCTIETEITVLGLTEGWE